MSVDNKINENSDQPDASSIGKDNNDWNKIQDNVSVVESQKKKLKYPKSIPFIIGNEFCERFTYYGMRTILVLYLSQELGYNNDTSTVIFHIFSMLVYFMCIPGAIIADSWLGKFMTILILSCVYVLGSLIVSLTSIVPLNLPRVELTMVGLALIALGSGGIKPCVAAFGGDQFRLPEQAKQAAVFFSIFYFSINAGSLVSTLVTPILRQDVHCFGKTSCYALAFGVPAILMCISIVIFVFGRSLYNLKPPAGNMLMVVTKTIGAAISGRIKEKKTNPREHWLDYADKKHDHQTIDDIKVLLRVLLLYIPLPVFWALFDQQGSRWTFQATRMDGTLGTIVVKPDQMQLINPFLILTFIPLYEAFFYPLLSKVGIRRPLQKLFCGGVLAGIAFVLSGVVELELEKTYPVIPNMDQSDIRIFNTLNCQVEIGQLGSMHPNSMFEKLHFDVSKQTEFTWSVNADCLPGISDQSFKLKKGEAVSFILKDVENKFFMNSTKQYIEKPTKDTPQFQIYAQLADNAKIIFKDSDTDKIVHEIAYVKGGIYDLMNIPISTYKIYIDDKISAESIEFKQGAVYAILISLQADGSYIVQQNVITKPNSLHMMWLLPQYFIMTLGEVMFSVTGLEFSYSQAPKSMKSVLQACWLLTVAFGNVIVIIIAEAKIFDSQAFEFFLFAGLMFVDMLFFAYLAYRYKPNVVKHDSSVDENNETVSVNETNSENKLVKNDDKEKDLKEEITSEPSENK